MRRVDKNANTATMSLDEIEEAYRIITQREDEEIDRVIKTIQRVIKKRTNSNNKKTVATRLQPFLLLKITLTIITMPLLVYLPHRKNAEHRYAGSFRHFGDFFGVG